MEKHLAKCNCNVIALLAETFFEKYTPHRKYNRQMILTCKIGFKNLGCCDGSWCSSVLFFISRLKSIFSFFKLILFSSCNNLVCIVLPQVILCQITDLL